MGTFVVGHPIPKCLNTYLKQGSSSVVNYSNSIGQLHRVQVGYLKQESSSVVEYSKLHSTNSIVFWLVIHFNPIGSLVPI
jgi:hypothetical protein